MSSRHSRTDARAIFQAAVAAADPAVAIPRHVKVRGGELIAGEKRYPLDRFRRVLVVGAGKATAAMALAVEKLLGARIAAGLINVKYEHGAALQHIEINEGGHPVPDAAGQQGARRMAELAASARKDDLVVGLISGGASALLPLPTDPLTLEAMQALTRELLAAGATIQEMNCVRKHLSAMAGGQLARLCYPATVLTLILSDVIGDELSVIGSGPTVPDPTHIADAEAVMAKYGLRVPVPFRETPKPGDAIFRRVQNVIVGSNRLAMDAAARCAKRLGYRPLLLSSTVAGETREIALMHAAIAREVVASGHPVAAPACILSGGETTVTLRAAGKGGRNQEFALAAAMALEGVPHVTVLSAGTDGTDGPTDAAGAMADGLTLRRARRLGLDAAQHLARHDSYPFFAALDDLVMTGPTGTNVMDVRLMLVR